MNKENYKSVVIEKLKKYKRTKELILEKNTLAQEQLSSNYQELTQKFSALMISEIIGNLEEVREKLLSNDDLTTEEKKMLVKMHKFSVDLEEQLDDRIRNGEI